MKALRRVHVLRQSKPLCVLQPNLSRTHLREFGILRRSYHCSHSSTASPSRCGPTTALHTNWSNHTHRYSQLSNINNKCLYYGVYRRFASTDESGSSSKSSSSSKKKSGKKKNPNLATPKADDPPEGDMNAKADIQHVESKGGELSTFVVIKEKTQETFSVIYIVGILMVCLPYTIYLVFKSLFSSSGSDKIRNETFDLIKEDLRILRILGNDIIAKQVQQNVSFLDDSGQQRLQVLYEIQGGKGSGRVDVEMLKQDKEWRMQYCIVTTQYSVIPIVDNRSLLDRPIM